MKIERDLYQEIDQDIRQSRVVAQKKMRSIIWILAIVVGVILPLGFFGWFFGRNATLPSLAFWQATATPTVTATAKPSPTFVPIATPVPLILSPTASPTQEASATVPPTETPAPDWSAELNPFLAGDRPTVTELTLGQIRQPAILSLADLLGYRDDALFAQLEFVRALSPNFIDDTTIGANQPLRGGLPNAPLFLLVGQMQDSAEFVGETGTIRLKVPGLDTPVVRVQLAPSLTRQSTNASLIINSWPTKGGWLWILANAPLLENALTRCRNTLPAQSNYTMPAGEWSCTPLRQLTQQGELDFFAELVMGITPAGDGLEPLLAQPATPLTKRWVYADLGARGLSVGVSADGLALLQQATSRYGLVRGSWQDGRFAPNLLLQGTDENGVQIYRFVGQLPDLQP